MLGYRPLWATRDPDLVRGSHVRGEVVADFLSQASSPQQAAADLAVSKMTAVVIEPGGMGIVADADVASTHDIGKLLGEDPDEFVHRSAGRAKELINSATFRRAHSELEWRLVSELTVFGDEIWAVVQRSAGP